MKSAVKRKDAAKCCFLTHAALALVLGGQSAVAQESPDPQPERTVSQAQQEEQIYQSQWMTTQERVAYQTRIRNAKTEAAREKIRAEHRVAMQGRADKHKKSQKKSQLDATRKRSTRESRSEPRKRLNKGEGAKHNRGRRSAGNCARQVDA